MFFSRPPLCREVKGAKREAPRPESASILHAATVRMAFACLQGVGIALTGSAFCPHGERKTVAVRNAHELGALAALGLPNQAPPFWAGTNVTSAKHSFRSNPPASRKCSASLSVMVSITPARTQFWKRRCTVWYAPYRGGKSCHNAPVHHTSTPANFHTVIISHDMRILQDSSAVESSMKSCGAGLETGSNSTRLGPE